jgi:hypothetical protein
VCAGFKVDDAVRRAMVAPVRIETYSIKSVFISNLSAPLIVKGKAHPAALIFCKISTHNSGLSIINTPDTSAAEKKDLHRYSPVMNLPPTVSHLPRDWGQRKKEELATNLSRPDKQSLPVNFHTVMVPLDDLVKAIIM